MEDEYLAVVAKGYGDGRKGKRGIDSIGKAFGTLVAMMEETRKDVLGDLFQGGVTYGEAGQFLTPETICELVAGMSIDDSQTDETVMDPCCGSGRMLLAYANHKRSAELVGQDVDLRCVKMTTLNLALRNHYGYVLWGNSLTSEVKLAYRTGMNIYGGVVRFARPGELAEKITAPQERPDGPKPEHVALPPGRPEGGGEQLDLF